MQFHVCLWGDGPKEPLRVELFYALLQDYRHICVYKKPSSYAVNIKYSTVSYTSMGK